MVQHLKLQTEMFIAADNLPLPRRHRHRASGATMDISGYK